VDDGRWALMLADSNNQLLPQCAVGAGFETRPYMYQIGA